MTRTLNDAMTRLDEVVAGLHSLTHSRHEELFEAFAAVANELRMQAGVGISAPYTPPKVVGIMSGHWRETTAGGLIAHSGLSYLTRSTSIHELLSEAGI